MIEIYDHPKDSGRVIVRMTGKEHACLNLARDVARELGRLLIDVEPAPAIEPSAA